MLFSEHFPLINPEVTHSVFEHNVNNRGIVDCAALESDLCGKFAHPLYLCSIICVQILCMLKRLPLLVRTTSAQILT